MQGGSGLGAVSDASWNAYLQNCGVWSGRRALVNARGKVLLDVPVTVVANMFSTPDGDQFVLWTTAVKTATGIDQVQEEWSRDELGQLGALTEDASFSAGNDAFVGERFSVDHCLFDSFDDFRVRSTFAYDWEGRLTGIVSSRERKVTNNSPATVNLLSGTNIDPADLSSSLSLPSPTTSFVEPAAWRSPTVLLDYTIGTWYGTGVILDAKTLTTRTLESVVEISLEAGTILVQKSKISIGNRPGLVVESSARIDGNTALFPEVNMQLMFLPGGVTISCPVRIWPGLSFSLELCLLTRPNMRRRILRCYDENSNWIKTMFITESRVG